MHAMSRIMPHGAIGSIQCSWVKLGDELCRDVRTTLYGTPAKDRVAAAEASDGVAASVRQGLPIRTL